MSEQSMTDLVDGDALEALACEYLLENDVAARTQVLAIALVRAPTIVREEGMDEVVRRLDSYVGRYKAQGRFQGLLATILNSIEKDVRRRMRRWGRDSKGGYLCQGGPAL